MYSTPVWLIFRRTSRTLAARPLALTKFSRSVPFFDRAGALRAVAARALDRELVLSATTALLVGVRRCRRGHGEAARTGVFRQIASIMQARRYLRGSVPGCQGTVAARATLSPMVNHSGQRAHADTVRIARTGSL